MSHPVTKTSYCVQLKQFKTPSKLRDWDNWLCMQPTHLQLVLLEIHPKYIRNTFEIHRNRTSMHFSDPNSWCLRSQKMTKKKIPVFPRTHLALLDALQLFLLGELTFLVSSWTTSLTWVLSCFIMFYHYPIYHNLSTIIRTYEKHIRSILEAYFIIILITSHVHSSIPYYGNHQQSWYDETGEALKTSSCFWAKVSRLRWSGGQKRPVANDNGDQHFAELNDDHYLMMVDDPPTKNEYYPI
jgi:hypothetical protein